MPPPRCIALWLSMLAWSLSSSASAQTPRVYLVELTDTAFPQRDTLLESVRSAIRNGVGQQLYKNTVTALQTKHANVAANVIGTAESLGGQVVHEFWAIGGAAICMLPSAATTLESHPDVHSVTDDTLLSANIGNQTGLLNHRADQVQILGYDGSGTTLALIDSGIDNMSLPGQQPHPAFQDAFGVTRVARAVGVHDANDTEDTTGHGTAVAGIATARDWSVLPTSDHGFALDAKVASYKITIDPQDNYWASTWIAAWHEVLKDRVALNIAAAVASYSGNPDPTHPTQRIVDIVAYFGDVLVASSAGNLGGTLAAAGLSQSNANGLAVGAVEVDSHRVWNQSSEGPLPGDPERFWPDLCAVGTSVFAPKPDTPVGTTLPLFGTSYAAPCVAGTALLLRGATPSASALDAKAWILNSVADLKPQNPLAGRYDYGLGMLRTDLAVEAMNTGTTFGGTAQPTGTVTPFAVSVRAGTAYAATLVWARTNTTNADWNDLDLRVLDPNGVIVAQSATPRNLYERVLFTPQSDQDYTIEVVATDTSEPGVAWSMVLAENLGGGREPGDFVLGDAGCAGTGVDASAGLVLPTSSATAFEPERTSLPFADRPTKTQQAFDGASIPFGTRIDAIAFRRDEEHPGAPSYTIDVEVVLGHTSTQPNQLGPVFATNFTGTPQVVLRDTSLSMPAISQIPAGPGQFDYVLPLTTPFITATSPMNHLVVEISVFGHSRGSRSFGLWFDAKADFVNHVRVVDQVDTPPFGGSGQIEPIAPAMSLITSTPGAIAPRLDFGGSLALGDTFDITLRDAPPGAIYFLLYGVDDENIGGLVPLPIDLGLIGAPGCFLRTSIEAVVGGNANAAGQAVEQFVVPTQPSTTGFEFFHQFFVSDPAANPLDLTLTNLGSGRVGG